MRNLNSINYNCPSIHFLICALFSVFREFFVYIQHSSIRALFYISQKSLHSSLINQAVILPFANYLYLSLINQGIFCLSRISSIFSLIKGLLHFANILHSLFHWSGLFLHFANIIHPSFRKNHTSNFLLFRAFFCNSRKSYIHLFIIQGFF